MRLLAFSPDVLDFSFYKSGASNCVIEIIDSVPIREISNLIPFGTSLQKPARTRAFII